MDSESKRPGDISIYSQPVSKRQSLLPSLFPTSTAASSAVSSVSFQAPAISAGATSTMNPYSMFIASHQAAIPTAAAIVPGNIGSGMTRTGHRRLQSNSSLSAGTMGGLATITEESSHLTWTDEDHSFSDSASAPSLAASAVFVRQADEERRVVVEQSLAGYDPMQPVKNKQQEGSRLLMPCLTTGGGAVCQLPRLTNAAYYIPPAVTETKMFQTSSSCASQPLQKNSSSLMPNRALQSHLAYPSPNRTPSPLFSGGLGASTFSDRRMKSVFQSLKDEEEKENRSQEVSSGENGKPATEQLRVNVAVQTDQIDASEMLDLKTSLLSESAVPKKAAAVLN